MLYQLNSGHNVGECHNEIQSKYYCRTLNFSWIRWMYKLYCSSRHEIFNLYFLPSVYSKKYIARQEEIPQVYVHFITIMAFLFSEYVRLWLIGGKADESSPSRTEVRIHGAIHPSLHIIPWPRVIKQRNTVLYYSFENERPCNLSGLRENLA